MSEMDIILSKINAENKDVTKAFITNEIVNCWDDLSQQDRFELATALFGHSQMIYNASLLEQRFLDAKVDNDDETMILIKAFNEKAQLLSEAAVNFMDISVQCLRSVFK